LKLLEKTILKIRNCGANLLGRDKEILKALFNSSLGLPLSNTFKKTLLGGNYAGALCLM